MGGTALGASGRSNNGLKLDVKTGKLSLWRLFPTFTSHRSTTPAAPAPQPEDDRKEHSLLEQDVRYSSWEKITDEKEEQV